jgi:alkaline phosphatase D
VTLEEYRVLYSVNKADADLQAAHAAFPWIVTWDDHEVEDNYASLTPGGIGRSLNPDADAEFPARRAAAYQAYWEHMPLRTGPPGSDGGLRVYRDLRFGDLVTAAVLDDRQYRDPIPDDAGAGALPRPLGGGPQIPEAFDDDRTLLGLEQEAWLENVLRDADTTWRLLVQQTLMAELDRRPDLDDAGFSADTWDGYVAARDRLLGFAHDEGVTNLVSLGGDIHTAAVADLKPDYKDAASPVVGAELIAPSISALELIAPEAIEGARSNRHVHEYEPSRRGWLLVSVTHERLTGEFRYVLDPLVADSGSESGGTWVVDAGNPQIRRG